MASAIEAEANMEEEMFEMSDQNSHGAEQNLRESSPISLPSPIVILRKECADFNNDHLINSQIINLPMGLIKFYNINRNKNLIIYPTSQEARTKIMECKKFFADFKKIDPSSIDNRPMVILKDLPFKLAQSDSHSQQLRKNGIIDIIEIKHRNMTENAVEIRKVKAVCDSIEARDKILKNGLVLSCRLYYAELSFKQPPQCFNCFSLDHLVANCTLKGPLCGRCNMDKHEGACSSQPKCANCQGNHSSFYRGCAKYALAKSLALQKATGKVPIQHNHTLKEGFTRNYSAALDSDKKIESMFGKLLEVSQGLKQDISGVKQDISEVKDTVNYRIDEIIENYPTKLEMEERFNLQASETNSNIISSANVVLNVFHDVFSKYMTAPNRDKLADHIASACRENMATGKEEPGELGFKVNSRNFFNFVHKRPLSTNTSTSSEVSPTIGSLASSK